jgi:Kef-type K+ transport system membrane component KefB
VSAAAIGIFVVLRAIRRHPAVRTLRADSRNREWALDLRLSLLALFGLSALATWFGTSVLIAGFAAGMVIALAGEPRRLAQQLLGIAEGFFVPFFFVSLGARLNFRSLASSRSEIVLALVLVVMIVASHLATALIMRMPWPAGLLASAQLGLPAGVVALGLTEGLITPGQGAAIVAAAVVTLGVSSIGAAMLSERLACDT